MNTKAFDEVTIEGTTNILDSDLRMISLEKNKNQACICFI